MTETIHSLAADAPTFLRQIHTHIEPLITWTRRQATFNEDLRDEGFADVYGRAAYAVTELEDLKNRFNEALGIADGEDAPDVDETPEPTAQAPTAGREAARHPGEALANPFIDIDPHETLDNVREGLAMISSMASWTDWQSFAGNRGAISGLHRHVETMRAALAFESDRVAKGMPPGGSTAAPAGNQRPQAVPAAQASAADATGDPGGRGSYFRDLLFNGDGMTAGHCQLSLDNPREVWGRCEDAIAMLSTHMRRVNLLLSDAHEEHPPQPSRELVCELTWTMNELGGLVEALRGLANIANDLEQGRRAARGAA